MAATKVISVSIFDFLYITLSHSAHYYSNKLFVTITVTDDFHKASSS